MKILITRKPPIQGLIDKALEALVGREVEATPERNLHPLEGQGCFAVSALEIIACLAPRIHGWGFLLPAEVLIPSSCVMIYCQACGGRGSTGYRGPHMEPGDLEPCGSCGGCGLRAPMSPSPLPPRPAAPPLPAAAPEVSRPAAPPAPPLDPEDERGRRFRLLEID